MKFKYINPIPCVDMAKKFEIRLVVSFDKMLPAEDAKEIVADYILSMDKDKLKNALKCEINPNYISEMQWDEIKEMLD